MSRVLLAVALALSGTACADRGSSSEARVVAIVDGEVTESRSEVVAITPRRIECGEVTTVLCTGTLIAQEAVLSAAHCFDSRRPGLAYEVVVGSAVTGDARRALVSEIVLHPEFDEQTRANDVAVLWLAAPINGVSPAPLPPASSNQPDEAEEVELVGFGTTEVGAPPDGLKRVGSGRVTSVGATVIDVAPDPAVSCVGDSGGPLFSSDGELVGVASSGDTGCRENSIYARVAPAVEGFIEPTLAIGPLERPPAGNTCGRACTFDADCPAGFVCVPGPSGNVFSCALPGEAAGALGDACTAEDACNDGFCAETEEDACRCYVACGSAPSSGGGGGGCSAVRGLGPPGAWLFGLVVLWWARRRR